MGGAGSARVRKTGQVFPLWRSWLQPYAESAALSRRIVINGPARGGRPVGVWAGRGAFYPFLSSSVVNSSSIRWLTTLHPSCW
jgi:hypothetical protein